MFHSPYGQTTTTFLKSLKKKESAQEMGGDDAYLFYNPIIIATSAFRFPRFAVAFLGEKQEWLIYYISFLNFRGH